MFTDLLVSYHTKRQASKKVYRASSSLKQASTFGIICMYQSIIQQHNCIDQFVAELKEDGKHVYQLVFKENLVKTASNNGNCFSRQDLNFLGLWTSDKVNAFKDKEFDLLLNLNLDYNMFVGNVIACSKAKCRVGIYNEESVQFLELMIKPKVRSIENLIFEMKDTLSRIGNE